MKNNFEEHSEHYDILEAKNAPLLNNINTFLTSFFKKHSITKILDVSCGTGFQAINLSKSGFKVTAYDISPNMIKIAKSKSKGLHIKYFVGDMRNTNCGKFDAIISILNSVSYLSKKDFKIALYNLFNNLKPGGFFIFDGSNKSMFDSGGFNPNKNIDTAHSQNGTKAVRFSKGNYDSKSGILKIKWETYIQKDLEIPINYKGIWVRQIYSLQDLEQLFTESGFIKYGIYDRNTSRFEENISHSFIVIARKPKLNKKNE